MLLLKSGGEDGCCEGWGGGRGALEGKPPMRKTRLVWITRTEKHCVKTGRKDSEEELKK